MCSTWPAYTPDTAYFADASALGLLQHLASVEQDDGGGLVLPDGTPVEVR